MGLCLGHRAKLCAGLDVDGLSGGRRRLGGSGRGATGLVATGGGESGEGGDTGGLFGGGSDGGLEGGLDGGGSEGDARHAVVFLAKNM